MQPLLLRESPQIKLEPCFQAPPKLLCTQHATRKGLFKTELSICMLLLSNLKSFTERLNVIVLALPHIWYYMFVFWSLCHPQARGHFHRSTRSSCSHWPRTVWSELSPSTQQCRGRGGTSQQQVDHHSCKSVCVCVCVGRGGEGRGGEGNV